MEVVARIAVVQDQSHFYDVDRWSTTYSHILDHLPGVVAHTVDLDCADWLKRLDDVAPHALLWRVWHRPDDLQDARTKIGFLERYRGIECFPSTRDLWAYDEKVRQLLLASEHGWPMPPTVVTRRKEDVRRFVGEVGLPLVAKAASGAMGQNVWLLRTAEDLDRHLMHVFSEAGLRLADPASRPQRNLVYLQQFVPARRDLRIVLVGDRVALAFWRSGAGWKHNVSAGARIEPKEIPAAPMELAKKISRALRFPWCAVDLIVQAGQPLLLEFSVQFGFSSPRQYETHFGSWDGGVLRLQAEAVARCARARVMS